MKQKFESLPFQIIAIFIITNLLGIFCGTVINNDIYQNPYVHGLVSQSDDFSSAFLYLGLTLFGAVVMILLIRYLKIYDLIFKIIEFTLISSASSIVVYSFSRLFLDYSSSMILGVIVGLMLATIKLKFAQVKNLSAILASAGVGAVFGVTLGPLSAVLFLILLSIYDYISVFKTKHMVEMADFVIEKDLAFTVTAQEEHKRLDLGTGDLIAPIMLAVSALKISISLTYFVLAGSILSLAIFIWLVWKNKTTLPALPPIAFGALLSLLVGFVLFSMRLFA